MNKLSFSPVIENKDLVCYPTYNVIDNWNDPEQKRQFMVAEIDPEYAGGIELCQKYGFNPRMGANCLVVVGVRGQTETYAACVVPVGYRYDMSGVVRKCLNARRVSVAPLDKVIEATDMEYGSITAIGLPKEWKIFIDPMVVEHREIIMGSGLKKSKICFPSSALLQLPNAQLLEGLAIESKLK